MPLPGQGLSTVNSVPWGFLLKEMSASEDEMPLLGPIEVKSNTTRSVRLESISTKRVGPMGREYFPLRKVVRILNPSG